MVRIPINEVKAGMILADDVSDHSGNLLMNRSHVLTEKSLEHLRKHNVEEVYIEDQAKSTAPASVRTPPIRVEIAKDSMKASITIDPPQTKASLKTEDLQKALSEAGVVFGVDQKALNDAVARWRKKGESVYIETAAQGREAVANLEGSFEPVINCIKDHSMLETIKKAEHFWQLPKDAQIFDRVDPGYMIARRGDPVHSEPGKNVLGDLVFSEQVIEQKVDLGDGAAFKDDSVIIAEKSGFAYHLNETIGVVPICFDGGADLEISNDCMSAKLIVHKPGERGKAPTREDIFALLKEHQVNNGILEKEIDTICSQIKSGAYPEDGVEIAKGIPPQNGENGSLEFLFNTETSLQPKVGEDGIADYKNIDIINPVGANKKLVRLIAPQKGKEGRDIKGNVIPATDGKAATLPVGANTEVKEDEPDFLISTLDGIVKYNGISVEVQEGYVVEGDVDFSTGNIKYDKSVTVNGDVKSGFSIDCGGDLQVGGTAEDCNIHAGGTVLCKHGFLGQGKGVIEAKGDINLGFMKNQLIRTRGNVNIAKEAINCFILSRKSIHVHGNSLSVAGGDLIARVSIIVNVVGNASGIRTNLEVGVDYTHHEQLEQLDSQLKDINSNLKKCIEKEKYLEKMLKIKRRLPKESIELLQKLKENIAKYNKQVKILEDRKHITSEKLFDTENAFIRILRSAMPGTMFKIKDRHLLVKDTMTGPKTIRLINGVIKAI
ncbi:FapA family protein [Chitinispirillales bacterium ANBcel5]|uniref:flagellar assembly protein A n=1 Tax=Cellulosispirillum alkaliphilum TaxID=3039283 RepID=UPI002A50C8AA|nr:FapA family protein [Chitinispirillales bacterium ANBcel5]